MTTSNPIDETTLKALTLQARKAEEQSVIHCAQQGITHQNTFIDAGARARWNHGYMRQEWGSIAPELGGPVGSDQWFEFARGQQAREIHTEAWASLANAFGGGTFGDSFAALLHEQAAEEPSSDSPRP